MSNSEHVNESGSSAAPERAEAIDWLLVRADGAEALTTIQGLAHGASSAHERDRNLAGLIGAPWKGIPAWRAL